MIEIVEKKALVQAAQAGDLEAFEALVREYHHLVITTAYHFLGNESEADDVAQEVWLRVFRYLPRFRFQSLFSTWLYRITANQALSALKKQRRTAGQRREDLRLDDPDVRHTLVSSAPGPGRILEGKEMSREFINALSALPRRQKMAVVLVLLQGLSHRDAGKIIGVAEKTVSWHLFKARKILARKLRDVR